MTPIDLNFKPISNFTGPGKLDDIGSTSVNDAPDIKNDKSMQIDNLSKTTGTSAGTPVQLDEPDTASSEDMDVQVGFILDTLGDENSVMLVLYKLMVLLQEAMRQQRESMQTARQSEYNLSAAATERQADDIMEAANFSLGLGITSCVLQGISAAISIGGSIKSLSISKGAPALDQKLSTARGEMTALRNDLKKVSQPQQQPTSTPSDAPDLQTGTTAPETGTLSPEAGTTTPEAGTTTPEASTTTPEASTTTPEASTTTPEASTTAPEAGTPTPEAGTTTPEAPLADTSNSTAPSRSRGEIIDDIEAKQVEIDGLKAERDTISDQLNNTQINTRAYAEGFSAVGGFMKAGSDYSEAQGQAQAKLDEADATRMEQQASATNDLIRSVVDMLTALLDILKGVQQSENDTNKNIMQSI